MYRYWTDLDSKEAAFGALREYSNMLTPEVDEPRITS